MADAVDNSTHKKYPKNRTQKEPKKIYYTPLYYSGGYTGAKRGRKSNAEKQKKIEDERFRFETKTTIIIFD